MKNQQTHLPTENMPRCNTITTTVQGCISANTRPD